MTDQSPATPHERRLQAVTRWLTTAGWALLIYVLSTATFGGSFTARVLAAILGFLHVSVSPETFALLHFLVRKLAHVTEYAIFGILLYRCFAYTDPPAWQAQSALWSFLVAAAYSLTDELHQAFVPGRGASLLDSAIDASGAALGLLGVYLAKRFVQARRSTRAVSASPPLEARRSETSQPNG